MAFTYEFTDQDYKLLDFAGQFEAHTEGDPYGSINPSRNVPNMPFETLDYVYRNYGCKARGRYQFVGGPNCPTDTLGELIRSNSNILPPATTLFSRTVQDYFAIKLLERRKYNSWKSGSINDAQFLLELSKEWAALPVPFAISAGTYGSYPKINITAGQSFYTAVQGNKAGVSHQLALAFLKSTREQGAGKSYTVEVGSGSRPFPPAKAIGEGTYLTEEEAAAIAAATPRVDPNSRTPSSTNRTISTSIGVSSIPKVSGNPNKDPYVYIPIDVGDSRYDFRSGDKIGVFASGTNPSNATIAGNTTPVRNVQETESESTGENDFAGDGSEDGLDSGRLPADISETEQETPKTTTPETVEKDYDPNSDIKIGSLRVSSIAGGEKEKNLGSPANERAEDDPNIEEQTQETDAETRPTQRQVDNLVNRLLGGVGTNEANQQLTEWKQKGFVTNSNQVIPRGADEIDNGEVVEEDANLQAMVYQKSPYKDIGTFRVGDELPVGNLTVTDIDINTKEATLSDGTVIPYLPLSELKNTEPYKDYTSEEDRKKAAQEIIDNPVEALQRTGATVVEIDGEEYLVLDSGLVGADGTQIPMSADEAKEFENNLNSALGTNFRFPTSDESEKIFNADGVTKVIGFTDTDFWAKDDKIGAYNRMRSSVPTGVGLIWGDSKIYTEENGIYSFQGLVKSITSYNLRQPPTLLGDQGVNGGQHNPSYVDYSHRPRWLSKNSLDIQKLRNLGIIP